MKSINVGIIGVGRIGKLHCDNLIQISGVNIAAITDPFMDSDWAHARDLKVVPDAEAIFSDPAIDAVFILSPSTLHAEQIIQAARGGKNIFCEKPVALDPIRIQEALEAVELAGVKLQIGFNRRFDPNFRHLKDVYEAGQIGDLYMVKIIARDPSPPPAEYVKNSGGIFLDMTIHDFDMVRHLSDSEVVEVYSVGAVLIDPAIGEAGDVDTAVTTLTLENGALAIIDNSRKAVYGYDQRIELFGSKGSITAENNTATRTRMMTAKGTLSERPLDFFLERYQDSFRLELNEFFEAISGNGKITADGEAGLVSILIGLAAKKSLDENRPIKIAEIRKEYFGE
ncbi:MAG: inositol 2-dehydrogenase [Candidatus Marinimicrobia bacterium]|nr:inositol 2-dehydrogenase [Candidatus Neomarinimicrobiota bacterium]